MNNYLIFRTDRIGDFLVSCILINNIKRNDPNSFITVVCSEKNYYYISKYEFVDSVLIYKKNLFSYFLNVLKLNQKKYNYTIIHDEKDRSKILNFLIRKDKTVSIDKNKSKTKIQIIKNIIYKLGFSYSENDLNIFDIKYNLFDKSKGDYIVFHYDEKWSNDTYFSNYINIEPNLDELIYFIKQLEHKLKIKIVITTGSHAPKNLIKLVSSNYFKNVEILLNQSFLELEKTVFNSKLLISCHGSVSHIAASNNISQIDIIDKSYDYSIWTSHFRKYNFVNRKKFSELSEDINKTLLNISF